MARITTRKLYSSVNAAWFANGRTTIPGLTASEARRAARHLYRYVMGKPFKGKIVTSRNPRALPVSWSHERDKKTGATIPHIVIRGAVRWSDLVHSLSHRLHAKLLPTRHDHDWTHAAIEQRMIEHVVANGWLDGAMKYAERPTQRKPAKSRQQRNVERVLKNLAVWEVRLKRATNKVKKLRAQKKRYDRLLAKVAQ